MTMTMPMRVGKKEAAPPITHSLAYRHLSPPHPCQFSSFNLAFSIIILSKTLRFSQDTHPLAHSKKVEHLKKLCYDFQTKKIDYLLLNLLIKSTIIFYNSYKIHIYSISFVYILFLNK